MNITFIEIKIKAYKLEMCGVFILDQNENTSLNHIH